MVSEKQLINKLKKLERKISSLESDLKHEKERVINLKNIIKMKEDHA